MGKPSSSCLKIIACGSDSTVDDDTQTSEAKGSADKRGWSFRKRSARHRVLSNNVTTESLTVADKEAPQLTSIPSQAAGHPPVSDKVMALEQNDEKQPPPSLNEVKLEKFIEPELSEISDPAKPTIPVQPIVSETLCTPEPQELVESEVSEAVHAPKSPELGEQEIDYAVLASEAIATVAVESPVPLRTSEGVVPPESPATVELKLSEIAIVSQADVLEEPKNLAETDLVKQKSIVKVQAAIRGHLVRRQAVDTLYCMQGIVKVQNLVKARHSNPSAEEVLASQSSIEKLLKNAFARQLLKSTLKSKSTVVKCDPLNPSPSRLWLERWMDLYTFGLANLEKPETTTKDAHPIEEVSVTLENGKSSINPDPVEDYETRNLLSNKEKIEQPYENNNTSFEELVETVKQKNESIQSSSHSRTKSVSLSDLTVETEDLKQVEVESKKSAHLSRKSSNPSFVAAQSKFEELSSIYPLSTVEYHLDTASSRVSDIKEKEPSGADSLLPFEIRANMGGSENGTELSVTSALDSPYLSEAEVAEVDLEVKTVEEKSSNLFGNESLKFETKNSSTVDESDPFSADIVQEKQELQVEQKKLDRSASDLRVDSVPQTEKLVHNSSPKASPSNNSSHKTGKVKKSKVEKRTPAKSINDSGVKSSGKRTPTKSLDDSGGKSSGKKTPNKPVDESGVRSSAEHSSKDHHKSERRRNSFGSAKSESADQEPRDSTSSTKIVPSYMQATKSARAKANSPRSSPDVQDSDAYMIKKRHSLPGARVERPAPQSQALKGNANTPPHERKWIR